MAVCREDRPGGRRTVVADPVDDLEPAPAGWRRVRVVAPRPGRRSRRRPRRRAGRRRPARPAPGSTSPGAESLGDRYLLQSGLGRLTDAGMGQRVDKGGADEPVRPVHEQQTVRGVPFVVAPLGQRVAGGGVRQVGAGGGGQRGDRRVEVLARLRGAHGHRGEQDVGRQFAAAAGPRCGPARQPARSKRDQPIVRDSGTAIVVTRTPGRVAMIVARSRRTHVRADPGAAGVGMDDRSEEVAGVLQGGRPAQGGRRHEAAAGVAAEDEGRGRHAPRAQPGAQECGRVGALVGPSVYRGVGQAGQVGVEVGCGHVVHHGDSPSSRAPWIVMCHAGGRDPSRRL